MDYTLRELGEQLGARVVGDDATVVPENAAELTEQWVAPLNDTLHTGVAGYYTVRLSDLAGRTVELIDRLQAERG